MKHRIKKYKLVKCNRGKESLMVGLATSLILSEHGRIQTTLPKAKALRSFVEPLITLGKDGTLQARRRIISLLANTANAQDVAKKLINEFALRYNARAGGYTRVIRNGYRVGDNADMAIMELV